MSQLSLGLKKLLLSAAVACLSVTAASAATKHVNVGQGGLNFVDATSGTSTTTINAGDTVQWDWVGGSHSTTSGTCGSSCTADGIWNSNVISSGSFSHTFSSSGTFHYFCIPHGTLGMQGMVIVNAAAPADFTISVSNPNGGRVGGPIFPSQQTIFDGTLSPVNGYNNTVNLSCQSGTPALPSPCTPSPASPMVSSSTPFTVTAGGATVGHYTFSVQGTDGTNTHPMSGLNFDVVDFDITSPAPSSLTAFAGATTTSTSVNLTAAGNFSGSVSVACGGLPPGAACNFTPLGPYFPTASAPVTVNLTVTVPDATTLQDYSIVLSAVSATNAGSVTKNPPQSLTLRVIDFNVAPLAVTAFAGTTSNPTFVNLTAGGTFSGTVALSCSAGLPTGATCGFSPPGPYSPTASTPVTVTLTIAVPVATAPQDYNLTLSALSGGVTKNRGLTLHVVDFSLGTPSPATVSMVNNSFSQPVTVVITPVNFSGVVTPGCGNLPSGVMCLFSPATSVNVNGASTSFAVVFEANGATPASLSNITITGTATINGTPTTRSTPLTQLNITAPASSTTITSSVVAVNSTTNSTLINVGDPNLKVTATVNNSGSSTYSAAVWEVRFSSPVVLVAASSNANCAQVLSTLVTCNILDVPADNVNHQYFFRVAPLLGRALVAQSLVTSPTVGSTNLAGNQATAPAVQIRHRPLARRGLVPKTP